MEEKIFFCEICAYNACFASSCTAKYQFFCWTSLRDPIKGTPLRDRERRKKPGRNQTHNLKSFAPYAFFINTAQIMLQVILFELAVLNALSVYMRNEPIIQIAYAADSEM